MGSWVGSPGSVMAPRVDRLGMQLRSPGRTLQSANETWNVAMEASGTVSGS